MNKTKKKKKNFRVSFNPVTNSTYKKKRTNGVRSITLRFFYFMNSILIRLTFDLIKKNPNVNDSFKKKGKVNKEIKLMT